MTLNGPFGSSAMPRGTERKGKKRRRVWEKLLGRGWDKEDDLAQLGALREHEDK